MLGHFKWSLCEALDHYETGLIVEAKLNMKWRELFRSDQNVVSLVKWSLGGSLLYF